MVSGGIIASCHSGGENGAVVNDTPGKGTIRISVDESFKPIIDSQIKVYMASNPEANIIAEYKPEAECLRDLQQPTELLEVIRAADPALLS